MMSAEWLLHLRSFLRIYWNNLSEGKIMDCNFNIKGADSDCIRLSRQKWDSVAKPIDGLGKLESLINKIAGVKGRVDFRLNRRAMLIFCADNGVVCEGVTQTDNSVTRLVAQNIVAGNATIARLSAVAGADAIAVDMGIDCETTPEGVLDYRIARGTQNIAVGAAMSEEQCLEAINNGIRVIKEIGAGYDIIGIGEMGIGNTTTTSAVAAVLLNIEPERAVGRGAGLSDEALARKLEVVKRAIKVNNPDSSKPLEVLSRLGGFDICGMVGAYIGCALEGIPVIADGVIGLLAAYIAVELNPKVADYILPSHLGKEPLCEILCERLRFEPVICADMALGEGSGAVMLLPLLDMAVAIYNNSTFGELTMTAYERMDGKC
jgi:nicotinate-nucleotide--dimethylbenzimidazole phosphoribosyltransferase